MTQNIYDNPEFFRGYSGLPRSVGGLAEAAEWPDMRRMLPNLRGRSVLDLGCGFGWFCRWARENGAARVLGVDISERMLARAVADTSDPAIVYQRADLEQIELPSQAYDLVYSSLVFHYVAGLERLFGEIGRTLVPGGSFVFSVEHPVYTAPLAPGWSEDASGRAVWPVNGYSREGERTTDWLAPGVIKQHRTIATYINLLVRTGFTVTHLVEFAPTAEQIAAHPDWAVELERPMFLLASATRA
ncbi:MAG: class I SAM-dependent methyltransferase [Chloroflexota bacterium]